MQPDTIIPNPANPQAFNRFSYVYNRPLNFNDPTGHDAYWCQTASCQASYYKAKKDGFFAAYGVQVDREFNSRERLAIMLGIAAVGRRLAEERGNGETAAESFSAVFQNGVTFDFDAHCDGCRNGTNQVTGNACGNDYASPGCVPGGGVTSWDGTTITFASMTGQTMNDIARMIKNVVHELGHAFYHTIGNPLLGNSFSRDALIRNPSYANGEFLDWEQHPPSMNVNGQDIPTELFADTFLAWTYKAWNALNVDAVTLAQNAMNGYVPDP